MNERQARAVTLLEAYESVQPPDAAWTDEDRAWADRVAVEAADREMPAAEFVAQRAGHALQRLGAREPRLVRWAEQHRRLGRWAIGIGVVAFAFGFVADRLDAGTRINLLAPPLWGIVAWNVAVYATGIAWLVTAPLRGRRGAQRPLVERLSRLLRLDEPPPALARAAGGRAGVRFATTWPARQGRLSSLRLQALLHVGAAALALGLVAGLYLRGLVHDYRVNWESTFLSPRVAHAAVTTLLEPASALSGMPLPSAEAFAGLRAAQGDRSAGAPAADWIHLLALTLGLVVVAPRLLLAAGCAIQARWRALRFALPLDEAYFRRIVRLQRGTAVRIEVFPYASTPSARVALALRGLAAEAFGARVAFEVGPTVAFGAEDEAPMALPAGTTHAVALFELGATPEAENHGRFVARLGAALARTPDALLAAVVDEGAFRARFGHLPERIEQRRAAWREWGRATGTMPALLDLEAAPVAGAGAALEAAFTDPRAVARP